MPGRVVCLAALLALTSCALPWQKPEEPPVPGTHLSSQIHGFSAVVPEGWVPLESNPVSFPDPNPFPGQSDRRIFVRAEPRAVLTVDVMLTPSDGRAVLPEDADIAKVRDLLSSIVRSTPAAGGRPPKVELDGKDLLYAFTLASHAGSGKRYLGLVRPKTGGGFLVVALVGDPADATLENELAKARLHLKVD